jgi:hypothetical protein
MKSLAVILLAAGSAAALFGMASAQPDGGGARAILFDQPNFQGRSIAIVDGSPDLAQWGFAGRAMSARFEGDWTVCDAPDLDGHCASVRGDVADLTQVGLRRIISLGDVPTPEDAEAGAERRAASGPEMTDENAPAGQSPPAQAARSSAVGIIVPHAPLPQTAPPAQSAQQAPATSQKIAYVAPSAAQASTAGVAQALQGDQGRSAVFFVKPTRGGAEIAVDLQGPANQFCHDQGLGPAIYFDTDGHVLRDVLCRRP